MNKQIKDQMILSRFRVIKSLQLKSITIPANTLDGKKELARIAHRIRLLHENIDFLNTEY